MGYKQAIDKFWGGMAINGFLTNKTMQSRCLSEWLSDKWVPELLLPPNIIRMFGPKMAIFVQKYAFLGTYKPCRLIWCPVGWLVGGYGAGCILQDTFLLYDVFIMI